MKSLMRSMVVAIVVGATAVGLPSLAQADPTTEQGNARLVAKKRDYKSSELPTRNVKHHTDLLKRIHDKQVQAGIPSERERQREELRAIERKRWLQQTTPSQEAPNATPAPSQKR